MNILITGIHGFVGSNLVSNLKEEHTIYGLDIVTSELDGVVKIYSCAEMASIPPVDVVIHLAGKSVETNDLSYALEYFESNAGLTRKIFSWFAQSSAKTFIYFSSIKAAADRVDGLALTEEMEPKPFGALGESKLLAEKYILDQYVVDKNVYVLRPSIIHGNGNIGNKNMRMMFKWVKSGYPLFLGDYNCLRSFTTLDNLNFVLKKMLQLNIPSGIYHVVDDECLTMQEVFQIMGSVLRKKVKIWHVNKNILKLIASIGTRFHLYFDNYRYKKISTNFVVNNDKIKKALGIERMPVSAVDGLTKSIISFNH